MRTNRQKRRGFSLTELLFALGVLSIGMVFVAGVFPAGLVFTIESSEQTIATVVADEAFAKVRLLAWDENDPGKRVVPSDFKVDRLDWFDFILVVLKRPPVDMPFLLDEFLYPSSFEVEPDDRNYCWSATGSGSSLYFIAARELIFFSRHN